MRTNIVLDDKLVEEAMMLSGVKTKKDLITVALREFVTSRKIYSLNRCERFPAATFHALEAAPKGGLFNCSLINLGKI